mgnify:CR=1 FL=1|jgi:uroporphyrinogen-III synthase|tara:strand:- start:35316 stop:35990 length:675 start_codon:yes stop_codon:yes gene_type:complete
MKVLITRPPDQAERSRARLTAMGHEVIVSPLLRIVRRLWQPPVEQPEAILISSANAVLAPIPAGLLGVRVLAMGRATAAAAEKAGFTDVHSLEARGASELYRMAQQSGLTRVLHICGRDLTQFEPPKGLRAQQVITYAADPQPLSGEAAASLLDGKVDVSLLYSTRSAATFVAEFDRIGADRARLDLALIGPAVAPAAGSGWRAVEIADKPDEDALFAVAGLLS